MAQSHDTRAETRAPACCFLLLVVHHERGDEEEDNEEQAVLCVSVIQFLDWGNKGRKCGGPGQEFGWV